MAHNLFWYFIVSASKSFLVVCRRSCLERRFYGDHDRKVNGSIPNLISLRSGIKCFTMIISAWWNLASSKLKKSEEIINHKTWKQKQLSSESGIVLLKEPPSLSRDTVCFHVQKSWAFGPRALLESVRVRLYVG